MLKQKGSRRNAKPTDTKTSQSTINHQTMNHQPSTINNQRPTTKDQPPPTTKRQTNQSPTTNDRRSPITNRQSETTITNHKPPIIDRREGCRPWPFFDKVVGVSSTLNPNPNLDPLGIFSEFEDETRNSCGLSSISSKLEISRNKNVMSNKCGLRTEISININHFCRSKAKP